MKIFWPTPKIQNSQIPTPPPPPPPNTSGVDVRTMIFNGLIYKQIDGVAMDSTLQPSLIKEILS